jgi:hypothetical protein
MTYKLLSVESDSKTSKGSKYFVLSGILYLAPSVEADGVHDLCPRATPECREACLWGAGMAGVFPTIKQARVRKTLEYLNNPAAFKATLVKDIHKLIAEAKSRDMMPAVRINGTSDLPQFALEIASLFPQVQFYDYTKIPRAWTRTRSNYHLTFSFSGDNLLDSIEALNHGVNVAVVFSGALPVTWNGYPVIDGDLSDLRFRDAAGVIVGLSAKGTARKMSTGGFIQLAAPAAAPVDGAAVLALMAQHGRRRGKLVAVREK